MGGPTGTVTLLFTDIEGSTRQWEQVPDAMAAAVGRHDRLLRELIESHGGFVFKTMGDAFCAAFATAPSALAAADAIQHATRSEPWPSPVTIKVRLALHSGSCEERDDDYFGPTVNRTARLMAVGAGGQVLLSGATRELVGDRVPDGTSIRDLGLHRLRDLGRPEHVFELVTPALGEEFAALRSLDNPDLPNNLPALLSSFIGRNHELEEVRSLVNEARLVTLTGAGGAGKTRLAVQAAAELLDGSGDGVWLVELAGVNDGALVPAAVASAIGLYDGLDVDPVGALLRALTPQRALFVLDNCEHLVDDVAKLVDAILRTCPTLHVLATSREPLGIDGERVYRVPSMSLPSEDVELFEDATAYDAFVLFSTRAADAGARITDEDTQIGASVCRRLDGIPLALELAAARLTSMSLRQLSDRLDQRFRLLTGGSRSAMARQQTLQATVEWSYGLLNPTEQSLLRRVSVFVGGFELDAAEQVCSAEDVEEFDVLNLLHSLVEKSLVVADQKAGTVRYRLLETIRQFGASELLRAGGEDAVMDVRDRHAAYFGELAARSEAALGGPELPATLARLDLERENLVAALVHLGGESSRAWEVLAIVIPLERFFRTRAATDIIPMVLVALDRVGDADGEQAARARLCAAFLVGWLQTSDREAVALGLAQVERAVELADAGADVALRARAHACLALFRQYFRDFEGSGAAMRTALELSASCGDVAVRDEIVTYSLSDRICQTLGTSSEQRLELVTGLLESATARADKEAIAAALTQLANLHTTHGDLAQALAAYLTVIDLHDELGIVEQFAALNNTALTLIELGRPEEADAMMRRALRLNRRMGMSHPVGDMLLVAAGLAARQGELERAAEFLGAADELRRPFYETSQIYVTELEQQFQDGVAATARDALGDAYDLAYGRGTRLSALDAVAAVLGRSRGVAVDA